MMYELLCTAHRCILTKGNDCAQVCTSALEMVQSGISKYTQQQNWPKMRLDEEQSVTQALLETIACAMTRATLSHFLPSFIGLLKLAIEIAHPDEFDMVEAIVSRFILRLVKLMGTLKMEQGDCCLKQLL